MNQQYLYNHGTTIIFDHNGNHTIVDYYDRLKEVLEQENLIEIMDHKKWRLVGKKDEYEREYQRLMYDQKRGLKVMIFLTIGVITIGLLLPNLLNKPLINSISFILPMLSITGVGAVYGLISDSKAKKYILENKQAIEDNLRKLEKQLELEKQYLEELKKDKTNTREKTGRCVTKLNGCITRMQNNETLKEFVDLYDFIDMTTYHYHWNHASENSYITSNNNEEEAQLTFIDEETNKLSLDENGKVLIKTKRMY